MKKNGFKNKSFKSSNLNKKNKLVNGNNKIKGNLNNYRINILIKNYIIINNYIAEIIIIIKFIIMLNLFCIMKNKIINFYYFQYSKIELKVKGVGESLIFNNYSENINFINEIYINGNKQDIIIDEYLFNQTDNFVELILSDDIRSTASMFSGCTNITEINLSNFNTSLVEEMSYMFNNCSSLTSLDLSNFNTSLVADMFGIFSGCSSLISIDLSNFNTTSVFDMGSMFSNCSSLIFLDLSNFNTSYVSLMDYMFYGCSSLTSLDLSNFNVSLVYLMEYMFYGCSSLAFLDLSSFNSSLVRIINNMFDGCSKLHSLDLSNFNTSLVINMSNMFYNCINLEYINLKNFIEYQLNESLSDYENMFYNLPENVVICINENLTEEKILPQIKNLSCHVIDCSNNWKSKQKKITNDTNECIESCDNSTQYKYEYNGKCYENCTNGFLYDENNNKLNKCKCELDNCLSCPQDALNKNLCTICNTNYYPKENDPLNLGEYIKCYKDPEGYYLYNNLYRNCYHTCKMCNLEGNILNHNCLECNENFSFKMERNNFYNCYENCSYYYYFDIENNYHCTINLSCPDEYPKLLENKMECVEYNIEDIKDIKNLLNNEINITENLSKSEEIKYYDNILKIIEKGFISENYDTSNIDNGNDEIINTEKLIITFTTTQNQKNNINNNMSTIDLGECEILLRNFYNISNNETLYMKKIDIIQDGMKALKIEYDVYCKLTGTNLIKLNLTICGKSKISMSIPYIIHKDLDKFNSSSGYYNDICYTTTTEDGTDISLKDRQTEYANNDKIVCQEGCDFSEYDYDNYIAKCSCKVKESSSSVAEMNIDKAKLLENFKDIKNSINFEFLRCYKKLFNKEGIIKNIGCYLILIIIFFHIICIYIFSLTNFASLKKKIINIALKMNKYQFVKDKRKKEKQNNVFKSNEIFVYKKNKKIKKKISKISKKKSIKDSKIKININPKNKIKNKKDKIGKKEIKENILNYIDEEINSLSYDLAKKVDNRTYCQYYGSLLITQHNLICALCNKNDYNSRIIKIDLYFINFTIEYTVNALFYNDDTMHKIYESKGQFDLENQIPIIVYSTIISYILNSPLNFLALSNDAIISFKQMNKKIDIMAKAKQLIKILTIKFLIYFIISFLFLIFFWYYISMFGAIYKNTQIHLLKDIAMSFGLSLLFPFVIYLFPGFFRIPAISNRKIKRECLYNFSKFLQAF